MKQNFTMTTNTMSAGFSSRFLSSLIWLGGYWILVQLQPCSAFLFPTYQQVHAKTKYTSTMQWEQGGGGNENGSDTTTTTNLAAQELFEKARQLRQEIEASQHASRADPGKTSAIGTSKTQPHTLQIKSPWSLVNGPDDAPAYRFYIDIGREEGTWMEPLWGASGQRIDFTIDVCFTSQPVNRTVAEQMVQDNRGSSSSPVFCFDVAPFARLRGGFDRMRCNPGGYRLDTSKGGQKTLRLFFQTEGKVAGDVSVPQDSNLYISLPVLADSSLSRKEGIVSVRQYGWHTGWYRLESRIVGVVKAVPLAEARQKDGF